MLMVAIVATVILGIDLFIGWICKAIVKFGKNTESWHNTDDHTRGFMIGKASYGVFDIYLIVTIWLLYANIGG